LHAFWAVHGQWASEAPEAIWGNLIYPGVNFLSATANVGKSTILQSLAMDLSAGLGKSMGLPLRSLNIQSGIWSFEEPTWLMSSRALAWLKSRRVDPELAGESLAGMLHMVSMNFFTRQGAKPTLAAMLNEFQEKDYRPALLVIDTLSSIVSVDSNNPEMVEDESRILRQLADHTKGAIVVCHHPSKADRMITVEALKQGRTPLDASLGLRGSSRWGDAADTILHLGRTDQPGRLYLILGKNRFGPLGRFQVKLEVVDISDLTGRSNQCAVVTEQVRAISDSEPITDRDGWSKPEESLQSQRAKAGWETRRMQMRPTGQV